MALNALADEIANVRQRIAKTIEHLELSDIRVNAFQFVSQRLEEMENECRDGRLKPAEKRWPELGRIAEETPPHILPYDLGGDLIEVEEKYIRA